MAISHDFFSSVFFFSSQSLFNKCYIEKKNRDLWSLIFTAIYTSSQLYQMSDSDLPVQVKKEPSFANDDDLTFDEEFRRAGDQENKEVENPDDGRSLKRTREELEQEENNEKEQDQEAGQDEEEQDEDEEEEEDDEEEDEEDEVSSRRKRRRGANQFFDIEAEVDDEEEDEEDEDEEAELMREEFITDDHAPVETVEKMPQDDRLHRQYDNRRQQAEDQDAEQLAETLKQRYRKTHSVYRGETAASGTVSQKLLMPSINDPSIYAIRCTPGREKELVRKLYEKKRTLERQGNPLDILTVFQRDAFTGYIYIEAKDLMQLIKL